MTWVRVLFVSFNVIQGRILRSFLLPTPPNEKGPWPEKQTGQRPYIPLGTTILEGFKRDFAAKKMVYIRLRLSTTNILF